MSIPATISGTVVGPDGAPVVQARVYFVSGPVVLQDIAALTNDAGEFVLSAPSEGTYRIGISADGFVSTTTTMTVGSGQATRLQVHLDRLGRR